MKTFAKALLLTTVLLTTAAGWLSAGEILGQKSVPVIYSLDTPTRFGFSKVPVQTGTTVNESAILDGTDVEFKLTSSGSVETEVFYAFLQVYDPTCKVTMSVRLENLVNGTSSLVYGFRDGLGPVGAMSGTGREYEIYKETIVPGVARSSSIPLSLVLAGSDVNSRIRSGTYRGELVLTMTVT